MIRAMNPTELIGRYSPNTGITPAATCFDVSTHEAPVPQCQCGFRFVADLDSAIDYFYKKPWYVIDAELSVLSGILQRPFPGFLFVQVRAYGKACGPTVGQRSNEPDDTVATQYLELAGAAWLPKLYEDRAELITETYPALTLSILD